MRRFFALLAALCLLLCCVPSALAADITILEQPQTQTVKAGGDLIFSLKARGAGDEPITWYITNPMTGETTTGKKLSGVVKGVKVKNPNSLKISINNIPESMHGWQLYCHIGKKGSGVNSDTVMILIKGLEPPVLPTPAPVTASSASSAEQSSSTGTGTAAVGAATVTVTREPIVIKGSKVDLYELDAKGNQVGTTPKHELTFDGNTANFRVEAPEGTTETIQYFSIGGIRFTPDTTVNSLTVRGWDRSATVRVKLNTPEGQEDDLIRARPEATQEPVDESSLVTVSCTNCRFTGGGNTFAESGKVPVGTTITVFSRGGLLKKGYSINGEKAVYKNEASFQMVVDGDTTITMEPQKF